MRLARSRLSMHVISVSFGKNAPYEIDRNAPSPFTDMGTPDAAKDSCAPLYLICSGTRTLGKTSRTCGSDLRSLMVSSVRSFRVALPATLTVPRPPPRNDLTDD